MLLEESGRDILMHCGVNVVRLKHQLERFFNEHMPVFALIDAPIFPKPALAEPNGLLAVGGDLRLERLVAAYRNGIFPWYDAESPILWWSPDPRPVVLPGGLQVARRLERTIRSGKFKVTLDADFSGVIRGCAGVRREAGDGT